MTIPIGLVQHRPSPLYIVRDRPEQEAEQLTLDSGESGLNAAAGKEAEAARPPEKEEASRPQEQAEENGQHISSGAEGSGSRDERPVAEGA